MSMNPYRIAADLIHVVAFIILYFKIWNTKSVAGLSGKTQLLYSAVFTTRYLDLFVKIMSVYNVSLKVLFILASYGIVYLIYIKFKTTYERDYDTFRVEFLYVFAAMLALKFNYAYYPIFNVNDIINLNFNTIAWVETLWAFSIFLEALAIIPQLYMVYKVGQMERFVPYYLTALFLYRGLYISNWIYKYYAENRYDMISISGGSVQFLVYLCFFLLYVVKRAGDDYHYEKKPLEDTKDNSTILWI